MKISREEAQEAAEALRTYANVAPHPVSDDMARRLNNVAAALEDFANVADQLAEQLWAINAKVLAADRETLLVSRLSSNDLHAISEAAVRISALETSLKEMVACYGEMDGIGTPIPIIK